MKRRPIAVAIVLMALLVFAGVLSFVCFSKQDPQNSVSRGQADRAPSSSSSSTPTSATAASGDLRPDQPAELKPTTFIRDPSWRLLDWSVKPSPEKPSVKMRASCWAAPGKHSFVRVEEQLQRDASGKIQVMHLKEMVGDEIIVKLPAGSDQQRAEKLAAQIGGSADLRPFAPDTWLFKLERKLESVPEGMEKLKSSGASIEYTEPNLIVRPALLPNDPKVTDFTSWHLYNNTQIDKDIHAAKAWDRRTSAAYGTTNKVIVAVVDCGVRYTHEDLAANMWRNPGEIAGDGRDNDRNGYRDDVYGIDPVGGDTDPMDVDGHGTHCAGEIGAVGNNGLGSSGVAWTGIQIMALRFISGGNGSLSDEVTCLNYARQMGARVINASYGQNGGTSQTEMSAINSLESAGVILVAAAGNNGADNNGSTPFYPASYSNSNIIAVGATDANDNRASYSNYGATTVDLFASGDNIYSCWAGSDSNYSTGSGTSFAAPLVVGAIALLIAEYPTESMTQIVARLINTNAVDVLPSLSGLCVTGGRLNLGKLLPAADPSTLPSALAWHRPDYQEPLINSAMRTPTNPVYANTLSIYSGLKKFNNTNGGNTNGLVDQNGGWLFYRTSSTVPWSSNFLTWHTNTNDYQFWRGWISNAPVGNYQYYLRLDFDSGARTTYSFYTNTPDGFATTTNATTAQASPFIFAVAKAPATLAITKTDQTYNGLARSVSITTTPFGLPTTVTYNGLSKAPMDPGTYSVIASISDPNYQGSYSASLVVGGIDNPVADANGNGTSDLLDYALATTSIGTTSDSSGTLLIAQAAAGNSNYVISMTALVRTNDPKLSYSPQAILDLSSSNWLNTGFTTNIPSQTNVPAGFERREYQFNAGTNPRAFLKLTIQQQP